jgi:hypothetical protein
MSTSCGERVAEIKPQSFLICQQELQLKQKIKMSTCQKNSAWKAENNRYAFLADERKLTPFVMKRKNHMKGKTS